MSATERYCALEMRLRELNGAVESMAFNVECLVGTNTSLIGLCESMSHFVHASEAQGRLQSIVAETQGFEQGAGMSVDCDAAPASPASVCTFGCPGLHAPDSLLHIARRQDPMIPRARFGQDSKSSSKSAKSSGKCIRKRGLTLAEMRERAKTPKVLMHGDLRSQKCMHSSSEDATYCRTIGSKRRKMHCQCPLSRCRHCCKANCPSVITRRSISSS